MRQFFQSTAKAAGFLVVVCGLVTYISSGIALARAAAVLDVGIALVLLLLLSFALIVPLLLYMHYQLQTTGRTQVLAKVGLTCTLALWPMISIGGAFLDAPSLRVVGIAIEAVFLSGWMLLGYVYLTQRGIWKGFGVFHIAWWIYVVYISWEPARGSTLILGQLVDVYLAVAGTTLLILSADGPESGALPSATGESVG